MSHCLRNRLTRIPFVAFYCLDEAVLRRRSLFRASASLAAGGAIATMPLGRVAMARNMAASWPNVTQMVKTYVDRQRVANIVVALGQGESAPDAIARGGLGFGSAAPAGLDSLYRIYSMTKPITGMAAMICIEDGLMRLDQPIADWLPGFAEMRVLKTPQGPLDDTVPARRPITVRHLLTHTAGFAYDIITKGPLRDAYLARGITGGQVSRLPIPGFTTAKPAPGLATWANRLAELPLMRQPGARWSYSVSIDLLGRVIEKASGVSLDAFLKERIFDPCGMDSTYFQVPRSEVSRLTDNYGILGGVPLPVDPAAASVYTLRPPIIWGGSGLVSSPRDYDRFLSMLLGYGQIGGRRVMGEAAVRMGTSNLLPEGASLAGTWLEGQQFGAGGRVHNGTFGWGGLAATLAVVDFRQSLRAGLFTQFMPDDTYPLRADFEAAVKRDAGVMQHG